MDRSKGKWYVVNTLSGQENKVKERIDQQMQIEGESSGIYEVLVPTERVTQVKQGRKLTHIRKFFPGYIFVRMELYQENTKPLKINEELWYFICQVQGVIGFTSGDKKRPAWLSESEVVDLLQQLDTVNSNNKPLMTFVVGEKVRVKEGAFENFDGIIDEIDAERGRLKLMVSIFGRSTPVELEFGQVERE